MRHVKITLYAQVSDIGNAYVVPIIRAAIQEHPAANEIVVTRGEIEEVE